MEYSRFMSSLNEEQPNASWSPIIKSLWYHSKGDWNQAHEIVDQLGGPTGNWVHAHLHRVEGDVWNADYWYRRAGKQRPNSSLEAEWKQIVDAILKEH